MNVVGRTGGVPAVDDGVEEAPAVELDDAAAHQGVGGERVGAVAAAVDDEHVEAGAGQEQGGGGAGGAGADDDDVVGGSGSVGGHRASSGSGVGLGVEPVR